ncbi:MAG TPA: hypothetical protein VKV74_05360 [Bryobacteraceae bacterium]|nr:hypothetical protein [Bryobacteraceae bacterium]
MTSQPFRITADEANFLAPSSAPKPKTSQEAAKQFESLLIAQMLRAARESMAGDGSDSASETMLDLAGQQFAQMLADRGGFGLSKLIEGGLQTSPSPENQQATERPVRVDAQP